MERLRELLYDYSSCTPRGKSRTGSNNALCCHGGGYLCMERLPTQKVRNWL